MPVIEVRGLRKRYGDTVAVDDVEFSVDQGEIFGILGPNGAGKTTTVECVEGMRVPDAGSVRVLGMDPVRERAGVRKVLGAQLQSSALPDKIRVGEAVELFASFYDAPADTGRLMRDLGLHERRRTMFENLSGGWQQRLSIALALVGAPRVAVLDELTTGLDPQSRRETWGLIRAVRDSGVTVLLVTHFMDEAERLCDRLAVIDRGRVVAQGTPAEVAALSGARERVRFRTAETVPAGVLAELSRHRGVVSAADSGGEVEVAGDRGLTPVVTGVLADAGVTATEIRTERATLDDAFLAITGRTLEGAAEEAA